ncbi:hypothetical protein QJ850_gp534 [Acanthamoeba polyphaga mimivirus]|uniref:Bro-N domain-containing protein n=1 Tax=Acanthamoeba polyphaga mimivirus Kroon TaxID=3069720 RepID=A0A0G2Y323_9VIRU|nr:hypothetical protein QJ850_gp534 [Acanthamoeba polyphaga mimivirus]AKI80165.1 hypothetical protein [Acanthamoeba polyphaga mimivirus Kroon]
MSEKWVNEFVPEATTETEVISNIQKLPPIIDIDDAEMWCDEDGNPYHIRIRGERNINGIYFSIADVGKIFGKPNLKIYIMRNNKKYLPGTDYKFFYMNKNIIDKTKLLKTNSLKQSGKKSGSKTPKKQYISENKIKQSKKKNVLKVIYLTYYGLIKFLMSVNTTKNYDRCRKFQQWACEKLFAIQFGTDDQKKELVANVLGVSIKDVKTVFNKTANTFPCIYLFSIGTVKNLRKMLNIPNNISDDLYVYKWGLTDDIERRAGQHNRNFQKEFKGCHVKVELVYFGLIDPQYLSKAEKDLKEIIEDRKHNLVCNSHKELAIIPNGKSMNVLKKDYDRISIQYSGHLKNLAAKLTKAQEKIIYLEEKHSEKISSLNKDMVRLEEKYSDKIKHLNKDIEHLKDKHLDVLKSLNKDIELVKIVKHTEFLEEKHSKEILQKDLSDAIRKIRSLEKKLDKSNKENKILSMKFSKKSTK